MFVLLGSGQALAAPTWLARRVAGRPAATRRCRPTWPPTGDRSVGRSGSRTAIDVLRLALPPARRALGPARRASTRAASPTGSSRDRRACAERRVRRRLDRRQRPQPVPRRRRPRGAPAPAGGGWSDAADARGDPSAGCRTSSLARAADGTRTATAAGRRLGHGVHQAGRARPRSARRGVPLDIGTDFARGRADGSAIAVDGALRVRRRLHPRRARRPRGGAVAGRDEPAAPTSRPRATSITGWSVAANADSSYTVGVGRGRQPVEGRSQPPGSVHSADRAAGRRGRVGRLATLVADLPDDDPALQLGRHCVDLAIGRDGTQLAALAAGRQRHQPDRRRAAVAGRRLGRAGDGRRHRHQLGAAVRGAITAGGFPSSRGARASAAAA